MTRREGLFSKPCGPSQPGRDTTPPDGHPLYLSRGPSVGRSDRYRRDVSAETSAPVVVGFRAGPSEPFEVTGDVTAALDACLSAIDGLPVHAGEPGHAPVALPTLPAVLALADAAGGGGPAAVLRAATAGRRGVGVVHGDTRIAAVRAVRVGDRLVFTSTVESVRSMGGATVLAVGTTVVAAGPEFAGPDGGGPGPADHEPVASVRSTFVLTAPAATVVR